MDLPNAAPSRRYLITGNTERSGFSVGAMLVELRRSEGWDHHGCIDSIRSTVSEMRILNGPRAGESVEITVESGYEFDPPFPSSRPTWLHELVGDERIG